MTAPLSVGGQCEGYAGLFMALADLLPVRHAWYAETDPAASTVLAHHFPGVENYGDITAADWAAVEPVDILTSGFPCQPFSAAGKRGGTGDERHLWPTGVLPAITALMPRLVVLENVPGLLTIEKGQVFGTVLADLDALGYTVSWTTIGACRVGACHHRHRIFVVATLAEVDPPDGALFGLPLASAGKWPPAGFLRGGLVWETPAEVCGADNSVLPTPRARDWKGAETPEARAERVARGAAHEGYDLPTAVAMLPTPVARDGLSGPGHAASAQGAPDLRTVVSMFPTPTARDADRGAGRTFAEGRPLSEVIVLLPTPRAIDGTSGAQTLVNGRTAGDRGPRLSDVGTLLPTPRASDAEKGGPNQRGSSGDLMLPAAVQPERFGRYAQAVRRHELAYGMAAPDPTEPGRLGKPRLSPEFPEWLQGLPRGWLTDHVPRKDAIRLAGNGVNPRQAAYALRLLPTFRAAIAERLSRPVAA